MSINAKFYAQAEEEIARRREINTEKINLRKHEIERAIPEYKAIKREMARTGEKLYGIILGGEQASEKLERLQRENLKAQETIKLLLQQHKYAPDYLNEIFTCQKCRDSGVYQNRRCSCFKEIVKRLAAEELNSTSPVKLSSFDTFDTMHYPDRLDTDSGKNIRSMMERNKNFCKEYAENFHLPCDGIIMQGKTGLGKTHLSLAIAKAAIAKGYSVIYGSAPDLLRKIGNERFKSDAEADTMSLIQSAGLLIFDDLGAEIENQYYVSDFYNLLNSRINAGLPTVISTNLDRTQLKKRYDDRIMSRLTTMEWLIFRGEDIRLNKKYGINP